MFCSYPCSGEKCSSNLQMYMDAQAFFAALNILREVESGVLVETDLSSEVQGSLTHVRKKLNSSHKDHLTKLISVMEVRFIWFFNRLFVAIPLRISLTLLCHIRVSFQQYPIRLRQHISSDTRSSVTRVRGKVSAAIGSVTECNKNIGMVLRLMQGMVTDAPLSPDGFGFVTVNRFTTCGRHAIRKAPKTFNRAGLKMDAPGNRKRKALAARCIFNYLLLLLQPPFRTSIIPFIFPSLPFSFQPLFEFTPEGILDQMSPTSTCSYPGLNSCHFCQVRPASHGR